MLNEMIIHLVDHYGYVIFYLAFCLGPFGIPVPNEITILTGGILADNGTLNPWGAYVCILLGLLTAVTIGYLVGKLFGQRMIIFLQKKLGNRYLQKVNDLFTKYGDIAICVGFLLPVVRYVVPVISGMNGVKYKKFVLLSYTSSIIWTSVFFMFGKVLSEPIMQVLSLIDVNSIVVVGFLTILIAAIGKFYKSKELSQARLHE
ncbi:putative membrane-associated protein [Schinkia azotoformans MEV2011]|uniref:Putative membrane-associated protein n=1 Tax=Schinkia azotoformans MEV2011 TaxID=1348973 RepID=A0A072NXW7_SCHAZ|nr:DedA family protein [Schinkia azotoformans]KEF38070.1 putative membrane-associated protein [Schinkia azotoformans MEV2011]MEC1696633.1 DedA family protein [Schinkia azotoformans]MEC1726107.1 DedA family protein [Schinkia azotoformans]MEC1781088.1 DedA family protein [Schinkia azotoformans]MED4329265.1 DedA family protein [Schinkia azotoformans]